MNEAETKIMQLEPKHIEALEKAERRMFHSDFCPYLELKALLPNCTSEARAQFCFLYTRFYGLNVGGLTNSFKERYFEILFSGNVILNGQPDYAGILHELSGIERKKGGWAMPFSFVSKLVAMRSESSPIYDRHVLAFFGRKAPAATVEKTMRIEWYVGFLNDVSRAYAGWANASMVKQILERLKARDNRLRNCHDFRLLDFLVWKVGSGKLLT
ncbi:MAG: hypothetical protein WBQ89_24520 [Candidatus Acidiferrum sp.]